MRLHGPSLLRFLRQPEKNRRDYAGFCQASMGTLWAHCCSRRREWPSKCRSQTSRVSRVIDSESTSTSGARVGSTSRSPSALVRRGHSVILTPPPSELPSCFNSDVDMLAVTISKAERPSHSLSDPSLPGSTPNQVVSLGALGLTRSQPASWRTFAYFIHCPRLSHPDLEMGSHGQSRVIALSSGLTQPRQTAHPPPRSPPGRHLGSNLAEQ